MLFFLLLIHLLKLKDKNPCTSNALWVLLKLEKLGIAINAVTVIDHQEMVHKCFGQICFRNKSSSAE